MTTSGAHPHVLASAATGRGARPAQPEPFVRGCAWPGVRGVPYPRAAPEDRLRLPGDTWRMACLPVGVRLEVVGDASAVAIDYRTERAAAGYRGAAAGVAFTAWTVAGLIGEAPAIVGEGTVELPLGEDGERTIVHLPEAMGPTVVQIRGVGGDVVPAPAQPRWVVYGDSVAEGWIASSPGRSWPALAGRRVGLDVVNLGYAGAARGEIASAEQVAALEADLLTVCHGTNCWTRTPHSAELFRAGLVAFVDILRDAHPTTPLLVVSPVIRPDAETTPNRLGATLADLRQAMEAEVARRIEAGDGALWLLQGLDLLGAQHLGDGIHPDDEGHRRIATAVAGAAREMLDAARRAPPEGGAPPPR